VHDDVTADHPSAKCQEKKEVCCNQPDREFLAFW